MSTPRRRLVAVPVLLVAMLAAAISSPPAQATSSWVKASSGVIYSHCQNLRYSFSATPEAGYTDDLVVGLTAYAPDGTAVATEHYYGETSGSDILAACELDQAGQYRIEMLVSGANSDGEVHTFTTSSAFAMRMASTHTSMAARRVGNVVRVRVSVTRESRHGDVPYEWAAVILQERRYDRWRRIPDTWMFTDETGRATVRIHGHNGTVVRARTVRMPEYAPITSSTSSAVTLP